MPKAAVADALSRLLSDTYLLYTKTQSFHWNVTGPRFKSLHQLFEEQYTDLAAAIDEIAERIRAVGKKSPGSFEQFKKIAKVQECTTVPKADEMIAMLADDQDVVAAACKKVIDAGEAADDEASIDLAVQRTRTHQKAAWMLRSLLEE